MGKNVDALVANIIVAQEGPCEGCQKLTLLVDENNTYYEYGRLQNLTVSSCRVCAMISAIRRSFAHEDGIEPSPDEAIVFVEHMPPMAFGKPRAFELLFYDNLKHLRWDFRFITIDASDDAANDSAVQTHLDTRLASEGLIHQYERVKGWLEDCRSNHDQCIHSPADQAGPPTRLLEIMKDKVRLVSTENLPSSMEYMSLSHMWGAHPENQLQLVTSRHKEFKSRVPTHEMSSIFLEAVDITRHLKCRYLWIDSLCIIQDSPKDWEKEASRMSEVYSNAICNLAFLYPPDDGWNEYRNTPITRRPFSLRTANASQKSIVIRPLFPEQKNLPKGTAYWNWLTPSKWPLFGRAWAFQEYLLARRTILYGRGNVLWQCSKHYCDESLGPVLRGKAQVPILKSCISASQVDRVTLWLELIREYRSRQLTRHEDRAMALAGTARVFSQMFHCTYLAGHLAEHIPHLLLWQMQPSADNGRVREPALKSAPSWSYFSVPLQCHDNINFNMAVYTAGRVIFSAPLKSYSWPGQPPNYVPYWGFYRFSGLRLELEVIALIGTVFNPNTPSELVRLSEPSPLEEGSCFESYTPDVRDRFLDPHTSATAVREQQTRVMSRLQSLFGEDSHRTRTAGETKGHETAEDERAGAEQHILSASSASDTSDESGKTKGSAAQKRAQIHLLLAVLRIHIYDGDIWLDGLVLEPGSEAQTWQRIGYWTCMWMRSASYGNSLGRAGDAIERLRASNARTIALV